MRLARYRDGGTFDDFGPTLPEQLRRPPPLPEKAARPIILYLLGALQLQISYPFLPPSLMVNYFLRDFCYIMIFHHLFFTSHARTHTRYAQYTHSLLHKLASS